MAGILRRRRKSDIEGAVARLLAAAGKAAHGDTLEHAVERFVTRTVETLCQVEKAVPERHRCRVLRQRISEVRARIAVLENLLALARASRARGGRVPASGAGAIRRP